MVTCLHKAEEGPEEAWAGWLQVTPTSPFPPQLHLCLLRHDAEEGRWPPRAHEDPRQVQDGDRCCPSEEAGASSGCRMSPARVPACDLGRELSRASTRVGGRRGTERLQGTRLMGAALCPPEMHRLTIHQDHRAMAQKANRTV